MTRSYVTQMDGREVQRNEPNGTPAILSRIYFNEAVASAHDGRLDDSLAYADQAIRLAPALIEAKLLRAKLLLHLGRLDECERYLVSMTLRGFEARQLASTMLADFREFRDLDKTIGMSIPSIRGIVTVLQQQVLRDSNGKTRTWTARVLFAIAIALLTVTSYLALHTGVLP